MSYGTRRSSAAMQAEAASSASIPIGIASSDSAAALQSSSLFATSLSSSAGKHKRPTTMKQRRLSSSTLMSHSLPTFAAGSPGVSGAARSSSRIVSSSSQQMVYGVDDDDDGEVRPGRKVKGETFACEKCNKLYAHERCLVKHRWEHTAHWKEASKLLLSKHQQVQLLEAAAILKAAQSGTSLPDEKGYWPAAVSPPTSGLLGSPHLNIDTLTARNAYRNSPSSTSAAFDSPFAMASDLPEESELGEEEEDDDDTGGEGESVSTGDDALDDGMFDLDLGGAGPSTTAGASSPAPALQAHHISSKHGQRQHSLSNNMDIDASATTSGSSSSDDGAGGNSRRHHATSSTRGRSVGHDSGFGSAPKSSQAQAQSKAQYLLHHHHHQQQQQGGRPAATLGAGLTQPAMGYFDGGGPGVALR